MKTKRKPRISTKEAVAVFLASPEIQNAFWSRVRLRAGCWEWLGFTKNRYGRFAVTRTQVYAHRLSYAYWSGVDPGELQVCHRCDNPPCTNPEHLFLGTQADNTRDMDQKGRRGTTKGWRYNRGEANPSAKITARDAAEIRRRHAEGETRAQLSRAFSLKHNHITAIVKGEKWT